MKFSALNAILGLAALSCASAAVVPAPNAARQFFTTNSGTDAGTTTCITFTFGSEAVTSTYVVEATATPTNSGIVISTVSRSTYIPSTTTRAASSTTASTVTRTTLTPSPTTRTSTGTISSVTRSTVTVSTTTRS